MTLSLPPAITETERTTRRTALKSTMQQFGFDAVLIAPSSSMRYFFGLTWGTTERLVAALVLENKTLFICPKFEDTALIAAIGEGYEAIWWEEDEDPIAKIKEALSDLAVTSLALDPNLPFGQASRFLAAMERTKIGDASALITSLRAIKSPAELALLQAAKDLTLSVHEQVFNWIKPGVKASEVKAEIDRLHHEGGADNGNSFCAVQFGEATSHPHGVPGDQALNANDIILIDTGCRLDGYNSDITRTYALTKQDSDVEKLWQLEKDAQAIAFEKAQIGEMCESVDTAARDFLASAGFGPDYKLPGLPHRTGHGIGLDIHEGPYLVRGDKTPLTQGMCFSNEPMIVIPQELGIRLEDHFYMRSDGPKWFTQPQFSLYKPFI